MCITPPLQIVTINCPVQSFEHELVQHYFGKFIAAKVTGFAEEHSKQVLPLGSYDFIADLVMICAEEHDQVRPIAVFKNSTLKRCEKFSLPFEMLPLFDKPHHEVHRSALSDALERARARGKDIGYTSSWTITPSVRANQELIKILYRLCPALLYYWALEAGIDEVFIGAATQFKVDKFLRTMGFNYFKRFGEELPRFGCSHLFGTETALMHLSKWDPQFLASVEQDRGLWEDRIRLGLQYDQVSQAFALT